jgi:hypothetical protein
MNALAYQMEISFNFNVELEHTVPLQTPSSHCNISRAGTVLHGLCECGILKLKGT